MQKERSCHTLVSFALVSKFWEKIEYGLIILSPSLSLSLPLSLSLSLSLSLECEAEGDTWALVNIIEPADVGRPIERVQEKMESLGLLPSSSQSVTSNELKGQPLPDGEQSAQQSNGEPQKCILFYVDWGKKYSLCHHNLTYLMFALKSGQG